MQIVTSFLFLASSAFCDEIVINNVVIAIHHVVPFAGPASASQKLEIYVPTLDEESKLKDPRPLGIFVWIHCGDGGEDDLARLQIKPETTHLGFTRVAVNFPKHSEATMKEDALYAAAAIRWVHEHAKDYQAVKDLIYVGGDFNGAQIAALVCMDESYLNAEGLTLSEIKGCVLVDGDAFDLPFRLAEESAQGAEKLLSAYGSTQNVKNYSPVSHLGEKKDVPPCLILEFSKDPNIESQGMRLYGAMKAAGFQVKIVSAFNNSHGTFTGKDGIRLDDRLGPHVNYSYGLFAYLERLAKPRLLETFREKLKDIHDPDSAEAAFGTPNALSSDAWSNFYYFLNDGSEVRLLFNPRSPGKKSRWCGDLFRARLTTTEGKQEWLWDILKK